MLFYDKLLFYDHLEDGESLYYVVHGHWVLIARKMLKIGFFGICIPLGILFFVTGFQNQAAYFLYAWIAIALIYSVYAFLDWYADAWLLTDVSVIDVRWDGPFKKSASRIDYHSIESIEYAIEGVKGTMLNYGALRVMRTSGEEVLLTHVANPKRAESRLSRLTNDFAGKKKSKDVEALKALLAEIVKENVG